MYAKVYGVPAVGHLNGWSGYNYLAEIGQARTFGALIRALHNLFYTLYELSRRPTLVTIDVST